MKTIFFALLLALSTSATAQSLTVSASRDFSGEHRTAVGIAYNHQVYKGYGLEAGAERFLQGVDQNRFSLLATKNVGHIGKVNVAAKLGGGYLDNDLPFQSGYVGLVGGSASYDLSDSLALTLDYRYQNGQPRVSQFDGSTWSTGLRYSW